MEKQINEAKNRLKAWWQDPIDIQRPLVHCSYAKPGNPPGKSWSYFRYARMIIKLLGNDDLKLQLRKAQDAPYKNIPPLPKASIIVLSIGIIPSG